MRVKESTNGRSNQNAIVNFLDIDTSKITFAKPKPNKYNGTQIRILYEGKTLFVEYKGTTPFGLVENFDKDGNYQGKSMQINCEGKYLEKAQELDQFFIEVFYKYKWSLNENIPKQAIEGYEHGESGLWKRICKKPYKVNEGGIREYIDKYPSKMEFSLFYKNDRLETNFSSWDKTKLDKDSKIGPKSDVKFIAARFSLSRGTFGLTLKPKLMQIMFREPENDFKECLLGSDEEDELPVVEAIAYHNPDYGCDENDDSD